MAPIQSAVYSVEVAGLELVAPHVGVPERVEPFHHPGDRERAVEVQQVTVHVSMRLLDELGPAEPRTPEPESQRKIRRRSGL